MNRNKLVTAITTASLLGSSVFASSLLVSGSSVVVSDKSNRDAKATVSQARGKNGYLNPGNDQDYAIIMEHLGYAATSEEESPMLYKMIRQSRTDALMQPTKYLTAIDETIEDEAIHHAILEPKLLINAAAGKTRLMSPSTVNMKEDVSFVYTTIAVKDPEGKQVGVPGSMRAYGGEADRSIALGDVDSDYIKASYEDDDILTLESVAIVKSPDSAPIYHLMTNQLYARALKKDSAYNGTLSVTAPVLNAATGNNNIRICLNRDHGDCDIPQLYPQNTPNELTRLKLPLSGEITTYHEITDIYAQGEGNAAITGNETGAWVMAGNASANGEWASMRNPNDGRTFVDYVQKRHFIDEYGFIGTVLSWDIPIEEAVFGVGANEAGTLFKRFENVQWEIRIKVKSQDTYDEDGNIETTGDRTTYPWTELETAFVAENAVIGTPDNDWYFAEKLPYLYIEYGCIAKGTMITMADGSRKAIEEVVVGDLVNAQSGVMKVQDTSIGYEAIPMIAISDDAGHKVLLTETHPVVTTNRGVVWAKEVVKDDVLLTRSGSSVVTLVAEEMYNDTVHNLELEPVTGMTEANEVMFANGIAVGDLGYQSDLAFKDRAPTTVESMLRDLPEEWHQDYLNSLRD